MSEPSGQRFWLTIGVISLLANVFLSSLLYTTRLRETRLVQRVQATQISLTQTQRTQIEQVHADAVARCQQGNTFRTQDLELWTKVLNLSSRNNRNQTPEQIRTASDFQLFLIKHDALVDCSSVH